MGSCTSDGMSSQQTTKTIVSYDESNNAYNSYSIAKVHDVDSKVISNLPIISNESTDGYKQIDFAYESGGDDDSNVSNKYKNDNKDYVSVSSLENQIAGGSNNNIKKVSNDTCTNNTSNYTVIKTRINDDGKSAEASVTNQSQTDDADAKNYKSPDVVSSGYITIFTDKGSDNEENEDFNNETNLTPIIIDSNATNYSTVVSNGTGDFDNSSGNNEDVKEANSGSNKNFIDTKNDTSSTVISPYTTLFQIAK